jgi:hypothetical protein
MSRAKTFLSVPGEAISPDSLTVPRARQLRQYLLSDSVLYCQFLSALRADDGREAIVFDVDVEVGQAPFNDILRRERIAAVFESADNHYPGVFALRSDFPQVPHTNLQLEEFPRSLCLYEQGWLEVKVRWTAASFVERIRDWLELPRLLRQTVKSQKSLNGDFDSWDCPEGSLLVK